MEICLNIKTNIVFILNKLIKTLKIYSTMKTEKIFIHCNSCNTVEEFKEKLLDAAKKHNLEFLLEYNVEKSKDEDGKDCFAVSFDDEMDLCLEVLEWLYDQFNYGSVSQFSTYVAESESPYKTEWDEMIGTYVQTREADDIEPLLQFDPNCEEADPEWKENLTSYVDMVVDVYDFLLN